MLEIKNLSVKIIDKNTKIIDKLNLKINDGEIHAIMGPNGTGKSTLAKTILGHYSYKITRGEILFNDKKINNLSTDERAKMGIFLSMQDPTVIDGVSNSEFIRTAQNEINGEKTNLYAFIKNMESTMNDLGLDTSMIHRSLNKDFSGGEKKKNEVLQISMLKPKLIILDEIDSGLDIDSLKIVCKKINEYKNNNPDTAILIITHYPRILNLIKPKYVHVFKDGNIVKTGDINLANEIEKTGYKLLGDLDE